MKMNNLDDMHDDGDGVICMKNDFPFYGLAANDLPMSSRELIDHFVPIKGIVTDGLTYYVYCKSVAS